MVSMATEVRPEADDADDPVRRLLGAGLPQARRLATYMLRNPHDAEDAVQEAAALAWSRRKDLRDPQSVEAWFSRILTNVCRKHLERSRKSAPVGRLEPIVDPNGEIATLRDELDRAIAQLRPDEQVVLGLRYGRDMTVSQIALLTGIREGTVKSRLHSAHQHLRAIIDAGRREREIVR